MPAARTSRSTTTDDAHSHVHNHDTLSPFVNNTGLRVFSTTLHYVVLGHKFTNVGLYRNRTLARTSYDFTAQHR